MFLAHELHMTRRELMARMDSREVTLWAAYFREKNKDPQPPEESKEALVGRIKDALMIRKKGKPLKDA